jgi:hypothetical protein
MIIESNQADWDDVVADLLKKVSDVYTFMDEDTTMVGIQPMLAIYGKIARQMLECADFIAHYSEIKRTREWTDRLHRHVRLNAIAETTPCNGMAQTYSDVLARLMQQFRTREAHILVEIVRDTSKKLILRPLPIFSNIQHSMI